MNAIYNEIDPFAAAWLEQLIADGCVAPGRVERRSVADLSPADVAGPGQRHFFAGIGGWSLALRLAGVPDDADVWTGSCPCQPFSSAGKGLGVRDPRHLWPTWFELIRECRPAVVFGEQVASRDGLAWLDLVRSDMERCGYAFGASDLCAAGIGAPHIRQRLYFVAYADDDRIGQRIQLRPRRSHEEAADITRRGSSDVANAVPSGLQGRGRSRRTGARGVREPVADVRQPCELGHAGSTRGGRNSRGVPREEAQGSGERSRARSVTHESVNAGTVGKWVDGSTVQDVRQEHAIYRLGLLRESQWEPCDWLPCTDGKARPVEPSTFPLAHGVPARVGRLRGYGNAIVPQLAAAFIRAALGIE